jgi:competence protein ComEC
MIRWIPYTFIRTVTFFIAGILLGIYLPGIFEQRLALYVMLSLAAVYVLVFAVRIRLNIPVSALGLLAFPFVFLAGYVHVLSQTESRDQSHFMNAADSVNQYRVVVSSYAERKERSWKMTGEVTDIKTDSWKHSTGKVLLYFPIKDFQTSFNYGDVLLIDGSPEEVTPPGNPGEFDYKRFLTFRNIYHQNFVKRSRVIFLKHDPPNPLMDYAMQARLWANNVLHQYVTGEREQAIAAALVLGVTDGLDNELLNAYAATGAMHVLAVSGLHISIIYLIILWFLGPLNKTKSGKWIVAIVSLIILWAYAFITGLSPSVLRAVTMFTFIAVARATSRNTNIYNTLAASCFCLLLFDPFLVMSVGFQLSYIAVIGIVYLQPMMYNLWEPRTWLADQTWKIICVSIAAQLATFALGLLYFHQFPNYFLLSNLLVIPVSFGVLILGLGLLAVSYVALAAKFVGLLLTLCIQLMNFCVVMVEWFPFSLIEGIYISTFQCWLLMLAIVFFILMIQRKKFEYLYAACFFTMVFVVAQWTHYAANNQIDKITVYKVGGHGAIDLISRGQTFFITDSLLHANADKIRFHIRPNRLICGVESISTKVDATLLREFADGKLIAWNGKTILLVTGKQFVLPTNIFADVVIVSNNAVRDLNVLKPVMGSGQLVLDGSNSFYYSEKILKQAALVNINAHSVLHNGAFEFIIEKNS